MNAFNVDIRAANDLGCPAYPFVDTQLVEPDDTCVHLTAHGPGRSHQGAQPALQMGVSGWLLGCPPGRLALPGQVGDISTSPPGRVPRLNLAAVLSVGAETCTLHERYTCPHGFSSLREPGCGART